MSEVYKEEKTSWMKHFDFIVLDILILQIAFNIGYLLRMETGWLYLNKEYTRLSIVLILIGICVGFSWKDIVVCCGEDTLSNLRKR